MVKLFLVISLISHLGFAQDKVFDFKSEIPGVTAKLKALKLEDDASFEDRFNKLIKELEQTLEREKNICIGELSTHKGEVVSKENRQVCLRKIKGHYLTSFNEIHLLKKRYMTLVHKKQLEQLDENFEKLKSQFEKNF